jgi:hypothetical protein
VVELHDAVRDTMVPDRQTNFGRKPGKEGKDNFWRGHNVKDK